MRDERDRVLRLSQIVEKDKITGKITKISEETDDEKLITVEQLIENRTEEILKNVWNEFDVRMYTKSSSRMVFFEANKEQARLLAEKEIEEQLHAKEEKELDLKTKNDIYDRLVDTNRKQYSKLLILEQKELQNQKFG